jgi:hypothetical protein
MSVYIQLFSGDIYEIEIFESCRILNIRRMLGIRLRQKDWGNHFNDDCLRFYSDDYQAINDDHFVEENEHYHAVIRQDDFREDPEVLLSFENGYIVFREFHSRQLLAINQLDEKNDDDDDFELLQSDGRVSWFSSSYRAHLSLYRDFLIEGINSIYQILTSHYGTKRLTRILSGNNLMQINEDNMTYFEISGNSDFDLIRLYIQTFFPFHIVGSIIVID